MKILKVALAPEAYRGHGNEENDGIPWIFGKNGPPIVRLDVPMTTTMAAVVMGATTRLPSPTENGYRGDNSDIADSMKPKRALESDQKCPKSLPWNLVPMEQNLVPTTACGGDNGGAPWTLEK